MQLFVILNMKKDSETNAQEALASELSQRYGEVMGGKILWHALGYKTLAAFKQSINRGTLTLPTFFIDGRKGRHALTSEVAAWLIECRSNVGKPSSIEVPESFKHPKNK